MYDFEWSRDGPRAFNSFKGSMGQILIKAVEEHFG
jgi:hypothetical protein